MLSDIKMKKRYKRKHTYKPGQREASVFPKRRLLTRPQRYVNYITNTDDKRKFDFGKKEALRIDGRKAEYILSDPPRIKKRYDRTKASIAFKDPNRIFICKRRKARREVLFSLRKIGKGKGSSKIRKMTEHSKIKC